MIKLIEDYLNAFREELKGSDRATIQDALSDAEDHLSTALDTELFEHPDKTVEAALTNIVSRYGEPEEVAEHYRNVEKYTTPAFSSDKRTRRGISAFCGIIADPSAWAALLYMILSLATGIVYFTWAVSGFSVSAGLMVLIIGVPLAWLFFLSFRALAFVEGRIVEALLGVRMPRRAIFVRKGKGWWGSIKGIFSTGSTWSSFMYLILMMPLGVLYFTVFITLTAVSLALITDPIFELILKIPMFDFPEVWWTPIWLMPFVVLAGVVLFLSTLHLAKMTGRFHGKLARTMLVSG
ncbi:MAG: sensor domain-containing protein [Candidatus Aegiribacteria sp.]|nr:sensor domain-containing protein [Candidatus Aegiribacteria sp.]